MTPQPTARAPIEVSCPTCGETTFYGPDNPYRPFCSARCQGHDFGAWANEAYRVEAPPTSEDQDEAAT